MCNKEYHTKQKDAVLDILILNKNNHFTADELLAKCLNANYEISRATLYRSLDNLVSKGQVRKFLLEDGSPCCYQYNDCECDDHIHLKCVTCGKLVHAVVDTVSEFDEEINNKYKFNVKNERTVIYGVCEDCQHEKAI